MDFPVKTRILLASVLVLGAACVAGAGLSGTGRSHSREQCRAAVRMLRLTDLALWYEALNTRHPSQADVHAPFGDGPGALERFPSGSMAVPSRPEFPGDVRERRAP